MPNQPHGCVAKKKADMVELRKRTKDKGTQAGEGCQKGFKAFCGWASGKISAGEGGGAKRHPWVPFPMKECVQGGREKSRIQTLENRHVRATDFEEFRFRTAL